MKYLKLFLLTGLIVLSITACNKKGDTGVIMNANDGSTNSTNTVVDRDDTNKSDEQQEDNEEQEEEAFDKDKITAVEGVLRGVWLYNKDETVYVYTFDNAKKFSIYKYDGTTEEYIDGTYETDNKTYVEITTTVKNEEEPGTEIETPSSAEIDTEPETETQRYNITYALHKNEYNETSLKLTLENDNEKIELVKSADIEEKTDEEVQAEQEGQVTEEVDDEAERLNEEYEKEHEHDDEETPEDTTEE